ncbi:annexin A11-like isoform X1 [Nyctibius grandis]|uniref:annexin A11-like isoform X1 n=1 Tax=Nyctibius grandis TaxID=48427 RepID=UPI0035BC4635
MEARVPAVPRARAVPVPSRVRGGDPLPAPRAGGGGPWGVPAPRCGSSAPPPTSAPRASRAARCRWTAASSSSRPVTVTVTGSSTGCGGCRGRVTVPFSWPLPPLLARWPAPPPLCGCLTVTQSFGPPPGVPVTVPVPDAPPAKRKRKKKMTKEAPEVPQVTPPGGAQGPGPPADTGVAPGELEVPKKKKHKRERPE